MDIAIASSTSWRLLTKRTRHMRATCFTLFLHISLSFALDIAIFNFGELLENVRKIRQKTASLRTGENAALLGYTGRRCLVSRETNEIPDTAPYRITEYC